MQTSHTGGRLVADIGGTNARFGWQSGASATIEHVRTLVCADHASLAGAFEDYLSHLAVARPTVCAIGIATPVTADLIRMTNNPWVFSQAELRGNLGLDRLLVINDFTALALAVPALPADALRKVGVGATMAGAAIGVIGPGTGLGVSGLMALEPARGSDTMYLPIAGEGGHVTLAAETSEEFAVLASIRQRYGHASAERVISGAGLLALYQALCEVRGHAARRAISAADVTRMAIDASDAGCVDALQMFCGFLGSVAGNLALTLGARGGVYIGGGIGPRLGRWFDKSPFRSRFESKGRFRSYLEAIPTFVIDAPESPALLGASRALDVPALAQ